MPDDLDLPKPEDELDAAPPAPEPHDAPQEQPDETQTALADLRAQLEEERRQRLAAEADASTHRKAAADGQVSLKQAHLTSISRALDATSAQMSSFKSEYAAALQNGDFAKVSDLQEKISEAAAKKVQLEGAKTQLEQMPDQPDRQPVQPSDPFEAALRSYTPRTQAWIRRHPDVLRDQSKANLAIAAHHTAIAAGHIPDTDAYFDTMERTLGYKADPPAPGRRPASAAPPSRSGTLNGKAVDGELRVADMTPRMHELADMAGLKPEEWLKHYSTELRAGTVTRIN